MQNHASRANCTFPRLIVKTAANGGRDAAVVGVDNIAIRALRAGVDADGPAVGYYGLYTYS